MTQNELLDGETILTQSDKNIVTLTNKRIRYNSQEFGKAHISGIMLENIGCVSVHYSSSIILLVIGILAGLVGLFAIVSSNNDDDSSIGLLIIVASGVFILLYFLSRKYFLTIYSNGEGKINFEAKGMKKEAILDFINKVEKAIDQRRKG